MFCPCLFVCLSVCLLAKLLKNACMDLDEMQTWSSRDLGLGLETSRDRILKVSVLVLNTKVLVLVLMPKVSVLVLNTKVLVLVLMPKVSVLVLVLKLGLGLGLGIAF